MISQSQVQSGILSWPFLPPSILPHSFQGSPSPSRSGSTHLGSFSRSLNACAHARAQSVSPEGSATLTCSTAGPRATRRHGSSGHVVRGPPTRLVQCSGGFTASALRPRDTAPLGACRAPGAVPGRAPAPSPFARQRQGEVGVAAHGTDEDREAAVGAEWKASGAFQIPPRQALTEPAGVPNVHSVALPCQ